jgi:hypothetical protein
MLSGLYQNVMLFCSQWCHNSSLLLTFCIQSFSFHIIKLQNSPTFSSFSCIFRFSKPLNLRVLPLLLSIYIQILCQSSILQIIQFIKWNGRPNHQKFLIFINQIKLSKFKWFDRWGHTNTQSMTRPSNYSLIIFSLI